MFLLHPSVIILAVVVQLPFAVTYNSQHFERLALFAGTLLSSPVLVFCILLAFGFCMFELELAYRKIETKERFNEFRSETKILRKLDIKLLRYGDRGRVSSLENFLVSAEKPYKKAGGQLFKNFIGDDGRVFACSDKSFFAFEKNGSIAWTVHLNYTCSADIAPAHGGSRKIYVVAENRVLKIHPFKNGTTDSAVEVFFGPVETDIVGIAVSISSSCVVINVKNRGLFALRLHGKLLWSAGPMLYRHGYRQGCRKCTTDCYFTSVPVIDHCEASIYVSNTVGELYSLSIRGPHFKWIQDFSLYGNKFTITSGNNGLLYVIIPDKAQILALEVSMGSIVWEGSVGPLSSEDYEPVVDANGWISIGSLDGFLYSFSPTGSLKKFPQSTRVSSVIQVNPVLDCSGYAVYVSQTEMQEREANIIGENTYVAAMKPRNAVFTMLVPVLGSSYWSESNHSNLLFNLSQSDMKHFSTDERTLLSFFAVSRNGNPLPCRATRQKLASSCSLIKPKNIGIYTGNASTIVLFLLSESVLLVLLAASVKYCCIFWRKKRLQILNLGTFLEKRRSLRLQQKEFDRAITELEQKASEEAVTNGVLETLNDLVKEREGIKRKLSTTYSLGRDGEKSGLKTVLPLYDGASRSHSFQASKKESVTIFHTPTGSVSSGDSSLDEGPDTNIRMKAKGKVEVDSSSDDEIRGFVNPLSLEHSCGEIEGLGMKGDEMEKRNMVGRSKSLRRRTMSFR